MTARQLEQRIAHLELILGINKDRVVTVQDIVNTVCEVYGVSLIEMKEKCRIRKLVEPRKMLCFLAHHYKAAGCTDIGKLLCRDHTSVIHLRESVRGLLDVKDEYTVNYFNKCKQIIEK